MTRLSVSKLVSALRTEGRYEYTSIYRESTHQCGVLATQKFFFYYNFSNHTSTKAEKKIDQFENVLVPLLPTMKGIAEKNSQVTLKKDKQHIIAIKKKQTSFFISNNFNHYSCVEISNLKLVWISQGFKKFSIEFTLHLKYYTYSIRLERCM